MTFSIDKTNFLNRHEKNNIITLNEDYSDPSNWLIIYPKEKKCVYKIKIIIA